MSRFVYRVLAAMTGDADLKDVFIKSSALALLSAFFSLPYFHYMIFVVADKSRFSAGFNPWGFLCGELFVLFLICLLSAMAGFSLYRRSGLPGLGNPEGVLRSLPFLSALGSGMIILSYFLFDRFFLKISPLSYPKDLLYIISFPFQGAFTDEIILRFCMVTLAVGLVKHKGAGVGIVSAFASLMTIKYFYFLGLSPGLNYIFTVQILLSFLSNFLLGYLYVTRGLLYSMALKFIFGTKYFLLFVLG